MTTRRRGFSINRTPGEQHVIDRECPNCPNVLRVAVSPIHFESVCPCCSSRFIGFSTVEIHSGSHNDYATYLCTGGVPS